MKSWTLDDVYKRTQANGDCIEWTGGLTDAGYGIIKHQGHCIGVHRFVYQCVHNEILSRNTHICHSCDNPKCINPAHLFAGTAKQNYDDMVNKGRVRKGSSKGSHNGQARLTEQQVREIKILIANNKSNREIGKLFEVSHATVSYIRNGKAWNHI